MRHFESFLELRNAVGEEIGTSPWLEVSPERINLFAEATDDHQWIHVDSERSRQGPFGGPIAHGYLTLSLLVPLLHQVYEVTGMRMGVNYGLEKVRFISPVPAGAHIRARATLDRVEEQDDGESAQLYWTVVIELRGADKPACVARPVTRIYR